MKNPPRGGTCAYQYGWVDLEGALDDKGNCAVHLGPRETKNASHCCSFIAADGAQPTQLRGADMLRAVHLQRSPLSYLGPVQAIAPRPAAVFSRGLAGPVSVAEVNQEGVYGPSTVERTETIIEMGVAYAPGVPSPMEGAHKVEPIVIDGLVVKTGGKQNIGLGGPVQYIKLSSW